MDDLNSQSPHCIGEMHIIILSKEELKHLIQTCPYKSMSTEEYALLSWVVKDLKTDYDQEKCWYDSENRTR